ncbi:MAG: TolC family protein [Candidatus Marinimicrobia bacterium]|nr:TolC family protein [Candidatus Neomarinimicrobiota bacterium]
MKSTLYLLSIITAISLSNCTSYDTKVSTTPIPLVQRELDQANQGAELNSQTANSLSLDQAIARALKNNYKIKAARLNIRALEATAAQVSRFSNPELAVEIENFAGSGPLSGFKSSETTFGIGQLIELGNKRQLRTEVANSKTRKAALEYEVLRLELVTEVRKTFSRLNAAQARLELTGRLLNLSDQFNANVDTLVRAGRYSSAEKARSEVEYQNVRMRRFRAESALRSARQELAATWGGTGESIGTVSDSLDIVFTRPSRKTIQTAIENSPTVMLADLEVKAREAESGYATSLRIPDPTFSTGFRRINETSDRALVAGVSIPIPILNRNRAGIEAARYQQEQSQQQLYSEQVAVTRDVGLQLESLDMLGLMMETLSKTIIPEAERAYKIINQNYRLGQYGLIDVIDSQRQLFDAQLHYLDTRLEYETKIIQLEGLLGRSITTL